MPPRHDPTRRRLLASLGAGMGLLPFAPGALSSALATTGEPKRLLVVMCEGGWDVSYCMDPKIGLETTDGPELDEDRANPNDREAIETFSGIEVAVNDVKRPAVRTFFQSYGDRVAAVRGIWVGAIAHGTARIRMLNGTPNQADPSYAAIAGATHGTTLPLGSLDLSGRSYVGDLAASAGQLGRQSQLKALLDERSDFPPIAGMESRPSYRPNATDQEALFEHLKARNDALLGGAASDAQRSFFQDRAEALDRAFRFRSDAVDTVSQLKLGEVPSVNEQLTLAVELLNADLCSAVTVDSGRNWDSHRLNVDQHGYYQGLFGALLHLGGLLDARDMWNDTLVVVMSEMTRTPLLNGSAGKDHWPHTAALVMGRGVMAGAYGGTDDRVESLPVDPVTGQPDPNGVLNKYDNFAAGVLASLDVDPELYYPGVQPHMAWKA